MSLRHAEHTFDMSRYQTHRQFHIGEEDQTADQLTITRPEIIRHPLETPVGPHIPTVKLRFPDHQAPVPSIRNRI